MSKIIIGNGKLKYEASVENSNGIYYLQIHADNKNKAIKEIEEKYNCKLKCTKHEINKNCWRIHFLHGCTLLLGSKISLYRL